MHRVQRECKIIVLREEIVYADFSCFHILIPLDVTNKCNISECSKSIEEQYMS